MMLRVHADEICLGVDLHARGCGGAGFGGQREGRKGFWEYGLNDWRVESRMI